MEAESYLKFLGTLLLLVGLIALAAVVIRRFGLFPGATPLKPRHLRRLRIEEALTIDTRRRLMLLRHDDQEHLVLMGPSSDLLISSKTASPQQEIMP